MKYCLIVFAVIFSHCSYAVSLCYDESPPYAYLRNDTDPASVSGQSLAMVQNIFKHIPSVTVKVTLLPWKRCQQLASEGVYDGILQASFNKQRNEQFKFSDPLFYSYGRYFALKSKKIDKYKLHNASHLSVGLLRGNYYGPHITPLIEKGVFKQTTYSTTPQQLMGLLEKGRVDIVLFEESSGWEVASRQNIKDKIEVIGSPYMLIDYRLVLSQKSKHLELLPKINEAIKEINK
ncbi:substrate-binding periplasmic protein [Flocculibacter collagenilyticus]|uniref:substrate-binding periplasmic protein n=1 Tax=Flocculibacter collagenilyticus TaxID=2744479 RepID=UPI0018F33C30|nr:transporter substrate-binding domain-containing protein [Flocculibacter collagenilyticus]